MFTRGNGWYGLQRLFRVTRRRVFTLEVMRYDAKPQCFRSLVGPGVSWRAGRGVKGERQVVFSVEVQTASLFAPTDEAGWFQS